MTAVVRPLVAAGNDRQAGLPPDEGLRPLGFDDVATVVFVGGGPRTVGLLERFAASADELLGGREVRIHVVDPYPAGGGRIWRREQSRLLWMNSMTSDVTIFTDESVDCEGPIVAGPDLATWVAGIGATRLEEAGLEPSGPMDFPPRLLQAEYLAWAWDRVVQSLPPSVTVQTHLTRAVDLTSIPPPNGGPRRGSGAVGSRVVLGSGEVIDADLVVLALGYLDREPTVEQAAWSAAAADAGLTYIGPGYTADIELGDLQAKENVVVRGFGQAFIDLMVLLTEGRGGWYDECGGLLSYHPSGNEPILYVGSRRGVPYHAKLGYTVAGATPVPTRYLTAAALDRLGPGVLDFQTQVRPLVEKELTFAHYQQLFTAHPERTRWSWERFLSVLDGNFPHDPEFVSAVSAAVPAAEDRFVPAEVDRPLDGQVFADHGRLERTLVELIETDLLRRADPQYSPDLAVFNALLSVYSVLSAAITAGRLSDEDRVRHVETEWHGFFSFVASGPPPRRLEELLALHRAGIVHFAGPDLTVALSKDRFVATSPAVPGVEIEARAFVEARLPRPDVLAATDPLVRGLLRSGLLAADQLIAADGTSLGGGQLKADASCRAITADGSVHPTLFLLGPSVSGSAGSSGFSRPYFNGPGFRQNDAVARQLLRQLDVSSATSAQKAGHRHAS
ncbi:FAD/NAD(P)-binding protein [Kribbella monticola]|uniref:FAD/NAD(P)-binding protein n=1 Tax=Kribbella monticola TaxID=2185285 RepID=UPI000DD3FE96|nr:FAD/NAD(P)-binding protein [Kribbella monticola]